LQPPYTPPADSLSLHDALPISIDHDLARQLVFGQRFLDGDAAATLAVPSRLWPQACPGLPLSMGSRAERACCDRPGSASYSASRSEEHTSELQPPAQLVFRLLL